MLVLAYLSLPPCTPDELIRLRNPATLLNLIEQQVANRFVYPQNDLFIPKGGAHDVHDYDDSERSDWLRCGRMGEHRLHPGRVARHFHDSRSPTLMGVA
jgi:hypothetical protein